MPTNLPYRFDFMGPHAIIQGMDWTRGFRLLVPTEPATPFVLSSPYAIDDYVVPSLSDTRVHMVRANGTAHASVVPTWSDTPGALVVSAGVTFMRVGTQRLLHPVAGEALEMDIRSDPDADTVLTLTSANGRAAWGYDPPKWGTATVYGVGQQVVPIFPNGWIYQVAVAGTSHAATQPTWPTALGGFVTDGTVTWRCQRSDAVLVNLRLNLAPADTVNVAEFGYGRYDLQLTDQFGRTTTILNGNVAMEREISK